MAIGYRCDTDLGCTFIVWDAPVTTEQWMAAQKELFADPDFPPGSLALADLRSAGGFPAISPTVVDDMARSLRARAPDLGQIRFAIVPNGGWDNAQKFGDGLEGSAVRPISFTSLSTACTWLGLDGNVVSAALDALRDEIRAGTG